MGDIWLNDTFHVSFFKISGSIMTLRFDSFLQDELEALPPCNIRERRQGSGGAGGGTDHSEITLAKIHTCYTLYIHDVQYNKLQTRGYGRRNGCHELPKSARFTEVTKKTYRNHRELQKSTTTTTTTTTNPTYRNYRHIL